MPQAKGAKAQVIIQKETAYKTDPASPDARKISVVSCGLAQSRAQEPSPSLTGNRNPKKAALGNTDVGGPLVTVLQAYMAELFEAVLGDVTTSGANPYTHVIKVGDSLPSYLIEKGYTDINQYFKYLGCKANSLSFNVTSSGFQNVTINFSGASETPSGTSFDATPTDLGEQSFSGFAISTIEEGGVAIADVVGIDNLTISNDLDTGQYSVGGAGVRDDLPEGLVAVTGTLRARFADLTLYNKAVNDTESSLKIVYTLGDGLGSAGNESLEIFIPELTFAPQSPPIDGPRGVVVSLPFVAYYDDSSEASAMQVTIKNTQSAI